MKYLFKEIDDSSNSELLSTLKINNFFNFYEKKENSNLKIQPFLNFSFSDQKKIINQVNVDSGLRMSSLNENSEFGDLFVSNQNDLNIGTKILSKKGKNLVNVKIQKLFTFGTKKIFIEDKKFYYLSLLQLELNINPIVRFNLNPIILLTTTKIILCIKILFNIEKKILIYPLAID